MLPRLGPNVPRRRNIVLAWAGGAVLRLMRFRVEGEVPDLAKFVIAVAPHTSNWDFVVGAAVMFALELRVAFIAKHTLFRGPFGAVIRWMGGVPVDRSSAHGVVAEAVHGGQTRTLSRRKCRCRFPAACVLYSFLRGPAATVRAFCISIHRCFNRLLI